jgi:hypothetical protein
MQLLGQLVLARLALAAARNNQKTRGGSNVRCSFSVDSSLRTLLQQEITYVQARAGMHYQGGGPAA